MAKNNQMSDHENSLTVLIPGLPDDLAMQCLLVRLARKYQHILGGVSKKWRSFLTSRLFVSLRQKLGLSEELVYVLSRDRSECLHWHVLDPSLRMWMTLPAMPPSCSRRSGVLDSQLYFIGGCRNLKIQQMKYMCLMHFSKDGRRWHIGALDGKVYAIGGRGATSGALTSWEIFDAQTSQWLSYDDQSIVQDLGESLVMDGKMYVRHISPTDGLSVYAARYDPTSKTWALLDDEMTRRWYGPAAVGGEDTCVLDQTSGVKLLLLALDELLGPCRKDFSSVNQQNGSSWPYLLW